MSDSNFDIWRLQSNSDIRGLIEAVRDGDVEVRKRALTAIRVLGTASAIPGLQTVLVTEKDSDVRNLLITTLDYLFQQEVDEDSEQSSQQHNQVVHLIAQLNSDNPEQIIRAAQKLGELKEKIATESLVMIFHKRELPADVRLAAAEALIQLESAPVEVSLLAAIRHSDWHHRRNAAAVLGQLSADWAVRPLAAALRDQEEIVRRTAYAALKRIGTPAALRAIQPPETVSTLPTIAEQSTPVSNIATASAVEMTPPAADIQPASLEPETSDKIRPPAEPPTTLPNLPDQPVMIVQPAGLPEAPPPETDLEANAPVDDEDTQPSTPTIVSDDVS